MVKYTNNCIDAGDILLVAGEIKMLKSALNGSDNLAKHLKVGIADNWTEFGTDYLEYSLDKLKQDSYEMGWLIYFPILKKNNTLIGSCGYKGKPTTEGCVEIGYEIAPSYRRMGYATQITQALIINAFRFKQVNSIIAHTLKGEMSSAKILSKFDFKNMKEVNDPEDGLIVKWELKRINFNEVALHPINYE